MNLITQKELYRELYGEFRLELYWGLDGELYWELRGELYRELDQPLGFPIHTDFRGYNTVC
jgi:hypothetical protein